MRNESPRGKRQTAKIAAIPLLLLILWKVVAAKSTDDELATTQPTKPPNASAASTSGRAGSAASPPRQRTWPDWSIAEVVRHNPFTFTGRRDPPTSDAAVAQSNDEPEGLEPIEAELSAYMLSSRGEVALIEGQLVRVGDVIDQQWIVTELTPDGATLAPLAAPSTDR